MPIPAFAPTDNGSVTGALVDGVLDGGMLVETGINGVVLAGTALLADVLAAAVLAAPTALLVTVAASTKDIVSPRALPKLATASKLDVQVMSPLVVPLQEHCPGAPSAVFVVDPGHPLQRTEPLATSESSHCTRPRSCWCDVSLGGQLGSVKSGSVHPDTYVVRSVHNVSRRL